MWAIARLDFGLTDEEFGAMTPYQFEGLLERQQARQEREELLNGILASTVANSGFCRPEEPAVPKDFMPSQNRRPEEPAERMTAAEFSQTMHGLAARQSARLGRG